MKKERDSRIGMSKHFDYLNHSIIAYIVKEYVYLQTDLSVTVGFGSISSINGSDEMPGCVSLPLSHVHSIKDGMLRFYHITREEEVSHDWVRLLGNGCLGCCQAYIEVHWSCLISVVITLQMNE